MSPFAPELPAFPIKFDCVKTRLHKLPKGNTDANTAVRWEDLDDGVVKTKRTIVSYKRSTSKGQEALKHSMVLPTAFATSRSPRLSAATKNRSRSDPTVQPALCPTTHDPLFRRYRMDLPSYMHLTGIRHRCMNDFFPGYESTSIATSTLQSCRLLGLVLATCSEVPNRNEHNRNKRGYMLASTALVAPTWLYTYSCWGHDNVAR